MVRGYVYNDTTTMCCCDGFMGVKAQICTIKLRKKEGVEKLK